MCADLPKLLLIATVHTLLPLNHADAIELLEVGKDGHHLCRIGHLSFLRNLCGRDDAVRRSGEISLEHGSTSIENASG